MVYRIAFTGNSQFLISGKFGYWINKNIFIGFVFGVNISPNQKYISACCRDGYAHLFDSSNIQNAQELIQWRANDKYACGTTFTPDSKMVLISGEGDIKLWNIDQLLSNDQTKKFPIKVYKTDNDSWFWSMQIRMNGSILISIDDKIKIWNMNSNKLIQTRDVSFGYANYISDKNFSVSRDMKYIITGGFNKLKVYEIKPQ